ncbi:MAG: Fic family protein [Chloroflexota bacterium]|nr:Fic family protein [Chloroflexota bacterium]
MENLKDLDNTSFMYYADIENRLLELDRRVQEMREAVGSLSTDVLKHIEQQFKIKGIYHSNAIEGNSLSIGETRMVVEQGLTLSGKTLRDQAEAKNLSHALDFMEQLASSSDIPITLSDIRQIHSLILRDIQDDQAGRYRDTEVRISGSDYEPPPVDKVEQEMMELGDYVQWVTSYRNENRQLPILAATAAHAWLARIHPFVDGNGRTARILMNLVLIRNGYPICIIAREERLRYYDALEESQSANLTPLLELIYENVVESQEVWEKAAGEQILEKQRRAQIATRFEQPIRAKVQNEYEVWFNAMELLKSYFKQFVEDVNQTTTVRSVNVRFKDFGTLSSEKYLALRDKGTAKRTWFFGIEFNSEIKRARYLFFFGYPDQVIDQHASVILILAKDPELNYVYAPVEELTQSNTPDIFQVGFNLKEQKFVASTIGGRSWEGKVEDLAWKFFDQVMQRDFGA